MCLHREEGTPFSPDEARYIARIAPLIGEGIRNGLLVSRIDFSPFADAPGVIVLGAGAVPISMTPAAESWLDELGHAPSLEPLPTEILALAAEARRPGPPHEPTPRMRVRTRAGRWATLHASRIAAPGDPAVAVVIQAASAPEVAPLIMLAYGLTQKERTLTGLVCRGFSTAEIAMTLHISQNTVQDHLKSIFEKAGVRSRRELVATLLREHVLQA